MKTYGQIFGNNDRKTGKIIENESDLGFSRDLSRITFSNSIRRLSSKTQVFPLKKGDHYINRLSHTIIVSNIAREIGKKLNQFYKVEYDKKALVYDVNIDLIESCAMGHDIGHTPFGHIGEKELEEILKSYDINNSFKHNLFSVKVLQKLEKVKKEEYGFDLAWQTIDGILKHTELPVESIINYDIFMKNIANHFFNRNDLQELFEKLKEAKHINRRIKNYFDYPYPLTLEGQIVKIADEIAQYFHDLEDLYREFGFENILIPFINKIRDKKTVDNTKLIELLGTFSHSNEAEIIKDDDHKELFLRKMKNLFVNDVIETILINTLKSNEGLKLESINVDNHDLTDYLLNDNLIFILERTDTKIVSNILFYPEYSKEKITPKDNIFKLLNYGLKEYINFLEEELQEPDKENFEDYETYTINEKIIPIFSQDVKILSRIIIDFRKEFIKNSKISDYDKVGRVKIKSTFNDLFNNFELNSKLGNRLYYYTNQKIKEYRGRFELICQIDNFKSNKAYRYASSILHLLNQGRENDSLYENYIRKLLKYVTTNTVNKEDYNNDKTFHFIEDIKKVKAEVILDYVAQMSNNYLENKFYTTNDIYCSENIEIEKKFIFDLKKFNETISLEHLEKKRIEQCYINFNPEQRVRKIGDKYFFTEKRNQSLARYEDEIEIPREFFSEIVKSQNAKLIIKDRYYYHYEEYRAEIDIYEGLPSELMIVEFEFNDTNHMKRFKKPEWALDDVTKEEKYKNSFLFKELQHRK